MASLPPSGHSFQNVSVGGQSRAHFGDSYYYGSEDPLALLPTVPEANVNAYETQHKNECLKNTRVSHLKDVYEWVDNSERCMYWLYGLAGTGKSTVARTVARKYSASASFFFSRDQEQTRHARYFFTSIAAQLARSISALRQHIREAIVEDRDIGALSLGEQWRRLVLKPLSLLEPSSCEPTVVVVIDALDECAEERDIRALVRLLAEATSLKQPRLRIFLTSRPETAIQRCFNEIGDDRFQKAALQSILSVPDVTLFLEHEFAELDEVADGFPGEDAIRDLANNSNGLFIWAETALRYVKDGHHFAKQRLTNLLADERKDVNGPERALYDIYNTVLRNAVSDTLTPEERKEARNRLGNLLGGIVVAFQPLSTTELADLFQLPWKEVYRTLQDISAILEVSSDETTPIRIHHPSFRDFVVRTDLHRDIEISVDCEQMHKTIAMACIALLTGTLKQDIRNLKAPDAVVDKNQSNQHIATSVRYACIYWSYHIANSNMQLRNSDQVHKFLSTHILHWLEALSWMGQLNYSILALANLESKILASESSELRAYLRDLKRFILYNRPVIESHPLQLYFSALIFAPSSSPIKCLSERNVLAYRMRRAPFPPRHWSSHLQTFKLRADIKCAQRIVFSPNSRLIAIGLAWNLIFGIQQIHVWDVGTGSSVQILRSEYQDIKDIAFLSNEHLLTASSKGYIQVWDVLLGEPTRRLQGWRWMETMCFSFNGKYLASQATNANVRIFELQQEGTILLKSIWLSDNSRVTALSNSGLQFVTRGLDNESCLWDVTSGTLIKCFTRPRSSIMVFSPDLRTVIWKSNNTIVIEDTTAGKEMWTEGQVPKTCILAFSLDGKHLAVGSNSDIPEANPSIRVYDVETGAKLKTIEGHRQGFTSLGLSPDKSLLVSTTEDDSTWIWDLSVSQEDELEREQRLNFPVLSSHDNAISAITFSLDGTQFVTLSGRTTLTFWNTATCEQYTEISCGYRQPRIEAMAFSWDSKQLFYGSFEKLHVLDITARKVIRLGKTPWVWDPPGELTNIAVSRAGTCLALGQRTLTQRASTNVVILLLDTSSGEVIQKLRGYSHAITAIAFNFDGTKLASASMDKQVQIWRIRGIPFRPDSSITINSIVHTLAFPQSEVLDPQHHFMSLSANGASSLVQCPRIVVEDEWIGMHGPSRSQRVVWLPPEHRPRAVAAFGNIAVFGFESGEIGIWEIEEDGNPQTDS